MIRARTANQPARARRLPGSIRATVVAGFALVTAVGSATGAFAASATSIDATHGATGERAGAACPTDVGVTVVVDFGPYGGVVSTCGVDSGTGLDTLESAGFTWAGTAQFWDFVCRINGLPTAADDPCVRTPPASAYWTYWHADRGGEWVYSNRSAGAYDPAAGTVEGWSFGAGDPPGSPPPPTIPPTSQPPVPPPPTSTAPPESDPTDPGPGDDGEIGPTTSTPSAPTTVATSSTPTPGSSTSASQQPQRSATTSASDEPTNGSAVPASSGSPLGTVLGLIAAAAVAAAGGVVVLRRRQ